MNYKIIHTTTYIYAEPVSLCHNVARLIPRALDNQLCKNAVVTIDPMPDTINKYEDFFGNSVMNFAIQKEHKKLTVTVESEIQKTTKHNLEIGLYADIPWEEIRSYSAELKTSLSEVRQYVPETEMTASTAEIAAYALQSYTQCRSMFEATNELMHRIHSDFEFKPGFTTIATPLYEVMRERKGVCQDFAHLAIACIRSLGLPARYVSGYLETLPPAGKEKLSGIDASHAWFSIFIPPLGWLDFDPTNDQIPGAQHITSCWGRDYSDIAPLKGVIVNSGPHKLSVSVEVKRVG